MTSLGLLTAEFDLTFVTVISTMSPSANPACSSHFPASLMKGTAFDPPMVALDW